MNTRIIYLSARSKPQLNKKKYISKHTGRHYRSGWCWDLRRSSWSTNRAYEHKQIDLYAMYCKPKNKIVWISANSTKKSKITFTDKALEDYDSLKGWNDSCEQAVNREFKFIKLSQKTWVFKVFFIPGKDRFHPRGGEAKQKPSLYIP